MELTAERNDVLLRLKDYKVWSENLESKVLEQKSIGNALVWSKKQLAKKVCSLREENRLLQKTNEELLKRCSKQKTVAGGIVGKLVKGVARSSVGKEIYIERAILK